MEHRKRREVWITRIVLVLLAIFLSFVMVATKRESVHNKQRIDAICKVISAWGNIEPPPTATSFGITLIVEARNGTFVLGCNDRLESPSEILKKLVVKYHLSLRG